MSNFVEKQLLDAAKNGLVSEVSSLLKDHPEINVNWTNPDSHHRTALQAASSYGHVEVAKLLFAHPNINVNFKDNFGQTALSFTCERGHEWLIASGRDLGDVKNKTGKDFDDGKDYTTLEMARKNNRTEVVLLERFMANPTQTRHELRVKLGVLDELAAEVFALTVFLCDDLLQLKPASRPAAAAATRFFAIASRLPMELQMILCHHAVGSMKQNILHKDSEAAFKSLARTLLLPDPEPSNPLPRFFLLPSDLDLVLLACWLSFYLLFSLFLSFLSCHIFDEKRSKEKKERKDKYLKFSVALGEAKHVPSGLVLIPMIPAQSCQECFPEVKKLFVWDGVGFRQMFVHSLQRSARLSRQQLF